ncbi:uncharacterized protein LOC142231193 [Haematobia irritans]|uniref:uncharacterized protein LOC142231193 n=1 Tax=Haematobia irritans TaxID=7368 RepID=UPI003F4FF4A6
MLPKKCIVAITLIWLHTIEAAKRTINFELLSMDCGNISKTVIEHSCDLEKVERNKFVLSIMFVLDHELAKNAEAEILLDLRPTKGQKVVQFLNVKMNACDALNHLSTNPILKTLLIELTRSSNLPYTCPVQANHMYKVANFTVTNNIFPSYTPLLQFNYTLNIYENRKTLVSIIIKGATIPR